MGLGDAGGDGGCGKGENGSVGQIASYGGDRLRQWLGSAEWDEDWARVMTGLIEGRSVRFNSPFHLE